MACKIGYFDVVEISIFSINLNAQHINGMTHFDYVVKNVLKRVQNTLEGFSINLNAQHINGMTLFDLSIHSGKLVKIHVL